MYPLSFEAAVNHAMLYEVGGFWKTNVEVEAGLISTPAQRQAVGYTNDPVDTGGETKFGVAKSGNPGVDITHLTWSQAKDIYFNKYWLAGSCDKMTARAAVLHFDGCVNHGVGRANKFLQQAVGMPVDGIIGAQTLAAVAKTDEMKLCNLICDERAQFYQDIVTKKPAQAKFLNGWLRRISEMRKFVTNTDRSFS